MNTQIVQTTLPEKLVQAIDNSTKKTIDTRAAWLRQAAFDKAIRDGILKRSGDPQVALDLDEVK